MQRPATPEDEKQRQAALDATGLLHSGSDPRFDRITRMASELFSVPVCLVSLIDRERQWFKSCYGLNEQETARDISFCGHTILEERPLIVEDTWGDRRFADNLLVISGPKIRFYAGVPLKALGRFHIGTLCIIDTEPRSLSAQQVELLVDLAAMVETLVEADVDAKQVRAVLEATMQEKEHRAQLVIEGTRVGTWQWNVQSGETVFNERWAEIVGYSLAELEPISITTWMDLVHPDDLAESEARLNAHFSGERDMYDCKCRMRHKLGHWVWVHDRGRVVQWTATGEPLLMYGTHADISEEVASQQALQSSRNELASLIENMPGVTYCKYPIYNTVIS
ncbi:PAS domain-containing protein [Aliidiomarina quisquiliarum]|uniref:PAS domain-containing protein n=1 Tax=Aliidiomarina quisquiliarum TaxID=2938947 RepID=UPI00208F5933|nr:PAS domain-containing protein [Aliidiomarina quisquiliarum]MCO4322149.1 PAS domain-containing protein [Aliidiomarina quisquiliarum]